MNAFGFWLVQATRRRGSIQTKREQVTWEREHSVLEGEEEAPGGGEWS